MNNQMKMFHISYIYDLAHAPSMQKALIVEKILLLPKSIKPLVSIANKWQAHLRVQIISLCSCLCSQGSTRVLLWDFVNREILCVDVALKTRLEWSPNASKTIPLDTCKERMSFDLMAAANST